MHKKEKRTRPIFVEMTKWVDCNAVMLAFRSPRVKGNCDFKFGPSTTKRRNIALKRRKEIKDKGEYEKIYVKFPAILMGKKAGEKHYKQIENFSDIEISIIDKDKARN